MLAGCAPVHPLEGGTCLRAAEAAGAEGVVSANRKRQVRQMVSVDELPRHVRDAVIGANGKPVRISMPKFDPWAAHRWDRTERQRKTL